MGKTWSRLRFSDYNRDYYGGALLLLIGLGVVVKGRSYEVGTLNQMGPGFLPVVLGVILTLTGIGIAVGARRSGAAAIEGAEVPLSSEEPAPGRPEWRGWLCILLGIVAFVVLGRYGGLLPASFAVVFISALGDRDNSILSAFVLALSLCVFGVVVFWWALQVQLPLFAWGN